jgi:hypothetical protein
LSRRDTLCLQKIKEGLLEEVIFQLISRVFLGWSWNTVIEYLPSMHEDLGLISVLQVNNQIKDGCFLGQGKNIGTLVKVSRGMIP